MSEPEPLLPAARAFDAIAHEFDARYGAWRSVAAQRRAVRRSLLRAFSAGTRVLEVGGGTGEDALFLAERNRDVLVTDASPAMVEVASLRLGNRVSQPPRVAPAERLGTLADEWCATGAPLFDGAYSNFAALNCVTDPAPVARALARLVRPAAPVILVLFGTMCPGEVVVQLVRRDAAAAFRRRSRAETPARLGGQHFTVRYHRSAALESAMTPWFQLIARRGIGVLVPPSAAEPWISTHPQVLGILEAMDRVASRPLALLGDHVLYEFRRTGAPAPGAGS